MPSNVPNGAKRTDNGMSYPPENIHMLHFGEDASRDLGLQREMTPDEILADTELVKKLKIMQIMESLAKNGQLQPVAARVDSNNDGVLVDGRRRVLGIILLNRRVAAGEPCLGSDGKQLKSPMPVRFVKISCNDEEALELSLIANLQRLDLDVIDRAKAAQKAVNLYEWTQAHIAEVMSCSPATVSTLLKLAELPSRTQDLLRAGKITASDAKVFFGLPEKEVKRLTKEIDEGRLAREVLFEVKSDKRAKGEAIGRSMAELRAALKESGQWGATQLLRWLSGELDDLADCFDVTACVGSKEKVVIAGREVEVHDAG